MSSASSSPSQQHKKHPRPEKVAKKFINLYYEVVSTRTHDMIKFYKDDSSFTYVEDARSSTKSVTGMEAIAAKLKTLSLGEPVEVSHVDTQQSKDGGVIVMTTGLIRKQGSAKQFVQTFFLSRHGENDAHYYILNEIFRVTGLEAESTANSNAQAVAHPASLPGLFTEKDAEDRIEGNGHIEAATILPGAEHEEDKEDEGEQAPEPVATHIPVMMLPQEEEERGDEGGQDEEERGDIENGGDVEDDVAGDEPHDLESETFESEGITPSSPQGTTPTASSMDPASPEIRPASSESVEGGKVTAANSSESSSSKRSTMSWSSIVVKKTDLEGSPEHDPLPRPSSAKASAPSLPAVPVKASIDATGKGEGVVASNAAGGGGGESKRRKGAGGEQRQQDEQSRSHGFSHTEIPQLYIRALTQSDELSDAELRSLFEGHGSIRKVTLKGHYGFVDMEDAETVYRILDALKADPFQFLLHGGAKRILIEKGDKSKTTRARLAAGGGVETNTKVSSSGRGAGGERGGGERGERDRSRDRRAMQNGGGRNRDRSRSGRSKEE